LSDKTSEPVDPELLVPAVGAVVFASDEPVRPADLAQALGGVELEQVEQALQTLQESYDQHPLGLRVERIAGGYRLATRSDVGAWVRRFLQQRNRTRLTPAALETLAIVAYRQPITAPEIQAIRGKDPAAALKSLLDKKLIRILGRKKVVGNPLLYGTRKEFLVHFGLDSLEDLPKLDDFDEFVDALTSEQGRLFVVAEDESEETASAAEGPDDEVFDDEDDPERSVPPDEEP